jgi:NADPH:quinone reductase-like Zn-dependent oxidoreductase
MQKVVIHRAGSYDQLKFEDHPRPSPRAGEVLIRIRAIGVNYADVLVRWGLYESAKKYVGWPITPGFEFSGEILSTGDRVQTWKTGDRVFGITRFGAYATEICVPEHQIFRIPSRMNFEEAAAFPAVYITAYHALFQLVRIRSGGTLLVHSAAGGVGTALLQLSRAQGFKAVGVVGSSEKTPIAQKCGATYVIDKSTEDLWTKAKGYAPQGYDAILDANGPSTLRQGYSLLAPTGKLITYGAHSVLPKSGGKLNPLKLLVGYFRLPRFNPLDLVTQNKSVVGFNVSFLFDRLDLIEDSMGHLITWIEDGSINPPLVTTYPFERVAEAHRKIESGTSVGKLVLVPNL